MDYLENYISTSNVLNACRIDVMCVVKLSLESLDEVGNGCIGLSKFQTFMHWLHCRSVPYGHQPHGMD